MLVYLPWRVGSESRCNRRQPPPTLAWKHKQSVREDNAINNIVYACLRRSESVHHKPRQIACELTPGRFSQVSSRTLSHARCCSANTTCPGPRTARRFGSGSRGHRLLHKQSVTIHPAETMVDCACMQGFDQGSFGVNWRQGMDCLCTYPWQGSCTPRRPTPTCCAGSQASGAGHSGSRYEYQLKYATLF